MGRKYPTKGLREIQDKGREFAYQLLSQAKQALLGGNCHLKESGMLGNKDKTWNTFLPPRFLSFNFSLWLLTLLQPLPTLPFPEWCMRVEGCDGLLSAAPCSSQFSPLQHGVPPSGCSSFREYHPVCYHGSLGRLQLGLLHSGLSRANNCSRSEEAAEVIEHLRLLIFLGAAAELFILQKYLD